MDLQAYYREVEKELFKVSRRLETLEDEGHYGSSEYDNLREKEHELEMELEGLEEEFDR